MKREPKDLPETELTILKALWGKGAATIRDLTDLLYPGGDVAHYATVQSLLDRLEEKGYVVRQRLGRAHTFSATVSREEFVGERLRTIARKLCGGSLTPLLTNLVRHQKLSEGEEKELRSLIRELDRKKKQDGKSH
jgi:BlaI family penicillinase repressor